MSVETLHVIAGCMFSGKTARTLEIVERAKLAGIKTQVIKPSIDTRWGTTSQVRAHNGRECAAIPIPTDAPIAIFEVLRPETKLLAIDEAQFFGSEIVQVVKDLLTRNVQVIVAGLPTDFRNEPFGSMPILLALADQITRLSAICTFEQEEKICGREATRTQRLVDGQPAYYEDPVVLIGAQESYSARCPSHHFVPRKT